MPKPQPWYAAFNQPPKGNPNHGRHRKPTPTTHGDPIDGTGASAGAPAVGPTATWRAYNAGKPIGPGQGARVDFQTGQDFTLLWNEPAPPTISYAGVRVGEIIGHRMWVVLSNNRLCSLAHYFIWEPGTTIEGKIDEQVAGSNWKAIYGGTYSFRDRVKVDRELLANKSDKLTFPFVAILGNNMHTIYGVAIGTIKCWGEVVEHERGDRAQFAKLHSIDEVIGSADLSALRERYLP